MRAAAQVKALHLHELQNEPELFDFAFVCVKSYDTKWATTCCRNYLKPEGAFVSFQNGINEYALAETVGAENCLGVAILIAAACFEPGVVERYDTRDSPFHFGEQVGPPSERAGVLVELFERAGVGGAETIDDLIAERWAKLSVNCYVNALGGISGLGSSTMRRDKLTVALGTQLSSEVVKVGRALGVKIPDFFGIELDRLVGAADGNAADKEYMAERLEIQAGLASDEGKASLLQDVIKGRRTEIEYLNGMVADKGREVGIATPACDAVVKLVQEAGIGKLVPSEDNLTLLATALGMLESADAAPASATAGRL
jgi:2-dehydropantoate 2-reductase